MLFARLPAGELERLAECVLEPIRFPGAVQMHGCMLIADSASRTISHISDNSAAVLGAAPETLLGRPLGDLFDSETLQAIGDGSGVANPIAATVGDAQFDLIVHRLADDLVIELEPFEPTPLAMIQGTRNAMRRLVEVSSVAELWERTAIEVRKITGFDRVMVYHFYPDEHGEVVAEARADDMEPYLGLHYPASDIPAQARALYVTKLSRMILNSHAEPAALLSGGIQPDPTRLDLSTTELRAVSPHHREFMRNMGQVSTFSLSLVVNHTLVGMITCAHRTERHLPYNIRDGLEILANQVSLQLASMREIERLAKRNDVREIHSAIALQLARSDDVMDALLHRHLTLLDLIVADGATVSLGGRVESIGTVPDPGLFTTYLNEFFSAEDAPTELVSNALSLHHPELATAIPEVAGLLVRRLGAPGDYIAWFRGELRHSVRWLGDMTPDNRESTLSPRNSFSEWVEEVTGLSEPWGWLPREAREFANDLQATLLQRAQSQLADLALRDPLTGLPNRRLFMERLQQQLDRAHDEFAVLFIDLDRFKAINDEHGHAAGDHALIHVASAVTGAARATDTVARLGGDEFVVIAEGVTRSDALSLARRILTAISSEPEGSPGWRVAGSIGIALAADLDAPDASHLLSAADSAMYRAKAAGRGQAVYYVGE